MPAATISRGLVFEREVLREFGKADDQGVVRADASIFVSCTDNCPTDTCQETCIDRCITESCLGGCTT